MAEIDLSVIIGQCLGRRIDHVKEVKREASAWQRHRNNKEAKVNWQIRADDAPIKFPVFIRQSIVDMTLDSWPLLI